jgi:hypothetical protein
LIFTLLEGRIGGDENNVDRGFEQATKLHVPGRWTPAVVTPLHSDAINDKRGPFPPAIFRVLPTRCCHVVECEL